MGRPFPEKVDIPDESPLVEPEFKVKIALAAIRGKKQPLS
jgi:hypothetical protein